MALKHAPARCWGVLALGGAVMSLAEDDILFLSQVYGIVITWPIVDLRYFLQRGPGKVPAKIMQGNLVKMVPWVLRQALRPTWRHYWEAFIRAAEGPRYAAEGDAILAESFEWPELWAVTYARIRYWPIEDPDAVAIQYLMDHESMIREGIAILRTVLEGILADRTDPIAMAQQTIQQLQQQLAETQQQLEALDATYNALVMDLLQSMQPSVPALQTVEALQPLAGQRVLVVGDQRHRAGYEAIIRQWGGMPIFFDGQDEMVPKDLTVQLIVIIPRACSHETTVRLQTYDAAIPRCWVPRIGIGAMYRALQPWIQPMMVAAQ